MRVRLPSAAIVLLGFGLTLSAQAPAASTTVLRLDGIGPLHLGMTRPAALETGWLANRATGCELGGTPLPVTYRFTGTKAPAGIAGTAEFRGNRLRTLSFTRGVRTSFGVTVRRTRTSRMAARYRQAGFRASVRFVDTFQGTFVTITRNGDQVLGGFGEHGIITMLAIPAVPVCE
jgi:hypothetical protein